MIEFTLSTLPNGLRVVHHFDGSTSQAAFNLLYNVGSRDESPCRTGMAHLFEHLMFGGSANVPDYDYAIEMAGGTNNAWTSPDFTNFYDILPAANIATAFWAESDRMYRPLLQSSLDVQRSVVIEEFKQVCLNKPYGDTGHLLRDMLYRIHPYRWPTIGLTTDHIEAVTLSDIEQFFHSHYAPNNAVLAVTGPVQLSQVQDLADKWFGNLEPRAIAPRTYAAEPDITQPRRKEVRCNVPQTRIYIAFPMPAQSHPDYKVADLITDILASGNSSRFYRRLVMGTDIFTHADASVSGSEEPGFLLVSARIGDDTDSCIAEAESRLWHEINLLADGDVSESELQRAVNRFESNRTFANISFVAKARELALCAMRGDDINTITPQYRAITTSDITRVARAVMQPQRACTLIYRTAAQ